MRGSQKKKKKKSKIHELGNIPPSNEKGALGAVQNGRFSKVEREWDKEVVKKKKGYSISGKVTFLWGKGGESIMQFTSQVLMW